MRIAFALSLALVAGCHSRPGSGNPPSNVRTDTLRGVVVIEGSDPGTRVFLSGSAGRMELASGQIRFFRLAGLDVQVVGTSAGGRLDVRDFRVRAAHGRPALDGTLRLRDGTIYLSLTDGGERLLRETRALFESKVGYRIWLVLSDNGGVTEFGVLNDPSNPLPNIR